MENIVCKQPTPHQISGESKDKSTTLHLPDNNLRICYKDCSELAENNLGRACGAFKKKSSTPLT
jgi:hypothetical protein